MRSLWAAALAILIVAPVGACGGEAESEFPVVVTAAVPSGVPSASSKPPRPASPAAVTPQLVPDRVLAMSRRLATPLPMATTGFAASNNYADRVDVGSYLLRVKSHLDNQWQQAFDQAGLQWHSPSYDLTAKSEQYESACRVTISAASARTLYCAQDDDGAVVLPEALMRKLWQQGRKTGDLSAAIILAHLYGHHVVHQLVQQSSGPLPRTNGELLSDCLSGAWTRSAYLPRQLGDKVLQKGLQNLSGLTEQVGTQRSPRITFTLRIAAWHAGFVGASPGACTRDYWR